MTRTLTINGKTYQSEDRWTDPIIVPLKEVENLLVSELPDDIQISYGRKIDGVDFTFLLDASRSHLIFIPGFKERNKKIGQVRYKSLKIFFSQLPKKWKFFEDPLFNKSLNF